MADILKEQVEVIKREIAIEDFDVQIASRPDAEAVFRTFPRPCLLGAPMQDLLAYCMLYVIKFFLVIPFSEIIFLRVRMQVSS